jgi:glycosyltransferase involved in cell wall biosynthesis
MLFPGTTEVDTSGLALDANAIPLLTPINPLTWLRARRMVRDFSPDVVVFQWWQPFFGPLVGTLARSFRRAQLRCVMECHNVFPHEGSLLDRALIRFALSAADHLITHSARDRELLLSVLPGKKISVSPLPPIQEFSGGHTTLRNGRTLLFFGKVRKYKGLEVLLRAMPKVLARMDCCLKIVGEFYDSIEKYRQLIQEYRIEEKVHIDNRYVANEEVPRFFREADVLILPYVGASQSGVARIALSNALPVIASQVGGLAEAIEDNVTGLLFPAGDSDALADRIVHYFASDLGLVFSQNILRTSAEQSGSTIIDVIEGGSPGP